MSETPKGIVLDMPDTDYHASPGASSSLIWSMAHLPASTVRWQIDNPRKPSPAMELGTLTHVCVLEPERFDRLYLPYNKPDLRTKIGKEAWAAIHSEAKEAGRIVVPTGDYDKAMRMQEAVHAHPIARKLLERGNAEVSMYADDPESGLLLRSREDWMPEGMDIVVDLKTTQDAGSAFARSAYNFGYHAKAHHYRHVRRLVNIAMGEPDMMPDYLWIAVESEPPHNVSVCEPDADMQTVGERDWWRGVEAYKRCQETGQWPGLPQTIISISPPPWVARQLDDVSGMGLEL